MTFMCMSEDSLWISLSFHRVGPGLQTQVTRLGRQSRQWLTLFLIVSSIVYFPTYTLFLFCRDSQRPLRWSSAVFLCRLSYSAACRKQGHVNPGEWIAYCYVKKACIMCVWWTGEVCAVGPQVTFEIVYSPNQRKLWQGLLWCLSCECVHDRV